MGKKNYRQWFILILLILIAYPNTAVYANRMRSPYSDPENDCSNGVSLFLDDRYDEALPLLVSGYSQRDTTFTDPDTLGQCALALGIITADNDQFQQAMAAFQVALEIFQDTDNQEFLSHTYNNIGIAYDYAGEDEEAISNYLKSVEIDRASGNKHGESLNLHNTGAAYSDMEMYDQADDYFQQALTLRRETGDAEAETRTLFSIGMMNFEQGRYENAIDAYQNVLDIFIEYDYAIGQADALYELGVNTASAGNNDDAKEYLDEAKGIYLSFNDQDAVNYIEEFQSALDKNQIELVTAIRLLELGIDLQEEGTLDKAQTILNTALQVFIEHGDTENEGFCYFFLGSIANRNQEHQTAISLLEKSLAIWQASEDANMERNTLITMGLSLQSTGEYIKSNTRLSRALELVQQNNQGKEREGTILWLMGKNYTELGELASAEDSLEQASGIFREINDKEQIANTALNQAYVLTDLGRYEEAVLKAREAGTIFEELYLLSKQASALWAIGQVNAETGLYDQALVYLEEAYEITQEINDYEQQCAILNAWGMILDNQGELAMAFDKYNEALKLAEENEYSAGQQDSLNNIGIIQLKTGQFEEALSNFQACLSMAESSLDRKGVAGALNQIGGAYGEIGDLEEALEKYHQALELARVTGYTLVEASALNNLGTTSIDLGNLDLALEYFLEAEQAHEKAGDLHSLAGTRANIGQVYAMLGDYGHARDYFEQAGQMAEELGNLYLESVILNNQGLILLQAGETEAGLSMLEDALEIASSQENLSGKARTLASIGEHFLSQNQYEQAIPYLYDSIDTIESIQGNIQVEELRVAFSGSSHIQAYDDLLTALWETRDTASAFEVSERARARVFLDYINLDFSMIPAAHSRNLLDQEQELSQQIQSIRGQLAALKNQPQTEWDASSIDALYDTLATLEENYADLLVALKLENPELSALVSVDPSSLEEIQSLLPEDISLISYYVTETRTYIFLLTSTGFHSALAEISQETLREKIESLRAFPSVTTPFPEELRDLYGWLIEPVEQYISTGLVGIIPHRELHYLPFSALTNGETFLGENHTLFLLPSVSTLKYLDPESPISTSPQLLALGNPDSGLPTLQYADEEVSFLESLFDAVILTGEEASETAFRSLSAENNILHLAAHGEFNQFNPMFSAIHLAADEEEDGRLEVHEIYSLDLHDNTDLVVMSACQSNLGMVSAGDEVVSLTRAFMFAGTPGVISSLWNVDDQATSSLMQSFYLYLEAGVDRAQALQLAQEKVREAYPNPYYWAGFVLTGMPGETGEIPAIHLPSVPDEVDSKESQSTKPTLIDTLRDICKSPFAFLLGLFAVMMSRKYLKLKGLELENLAQKR